MFYGILQITARSRSIFASSRAVAWQQVQHESCGSSEAREAVWLGPPWLAQRVENSARYFVPTIPGGLIGASPPFGWSSVLIPGQCLINSFN